MSATSNGFGKRGNVTLAQGSNASESTGGLLSSDNRILVWGAGAVIAVLLFMLFMASTYRRERESYRDSEGRIVYVGGGGGFMSGLLGGMLGYHMGKQAGAAAANAAAQNAAARSMPATAPASPAAQSTTMQRSGFGSTGSSGSGSSSSHSAGG